MKILSPVDGSAASMKALEKAGYIAKKENAELKIIHVIKDEDITKHKRNEQLWRQVDGSIISGGNLKSADEELIREKKELIDEMIYKAGVNDINTEKEVLIGEPYEMILKTAKDEKIDLIVIGNRGYSKIKRFFVGSVTQKVIEQAQCPVLVIHSDVIE